MNIAARTTNRRLPIDGVICVVRACLATLLLFTLCCAPRPAQAQELPASTYLVQFQPQTTADGRLAALTSMGAELVTWIPAINMAEVKLSPADRGLAASALATGPIITVEQDALVTGQHIVTDPGFIDADKGYAQKLINVLPAWDVTTGISSTVIAVIDTGLDFSHPEFAGRIVPGYDFINDDADAADDNGHGTHVAGIIAAGLNGFGTVGVCPDCRIMPIKALNENNAGSWSTVVKAIIFATDQGARVINLSLGAVSSSKALASAIAYAVDHNVVVIAAAGNTASSQPFYPAVLPGVIAVGATDRNDALWPLSNYGDYIDVTAPGHFIYSTYYSAADAAAGYAFMSGTSMAAPFVSGLAGLIISRQPDLTVDQVTDFITDNAKDLGEAGKDQQFGYGRIDVYRTMVAANEGVEPRTDGSGGFAVAAYVYIPAVMVPQ